MNAFVSYYSIETSKKKISIVIVLTSILHTILKAFKSVYKELNSERLQNLIDYGVDFRTKLHSAYY